MIYLALRRTKEKILKSKCQHCQLTSRHTTSLGAQYRFPISHPKSNCLLGPTKTCKNTLVSETLGSTNKAILRAVGCQAAKDRILELSEDFSAYFDGSRFRSSIHCKILTSFPAPWEVINWYMGTSKLVQARSTLS